MASIDRRTFVKAASAAGMGFAAADRNLASANTMQAAFVYEPGYFGPSFFGHGDIVTITGSGFGSKPTGPPLVWDDASGSANIRDLWTDGWPKQCSNPANDIQRRAAGWRGVAPPHTRTNRYIAGSHAEDTPTTGFNVHFWRQFPVGGFPLNVYASAWMRADPAWTFATNNDNNYKPFTWSAGASPYVGAGEQIQIVYPAQLPPPNDSTVGLTSATDTTIRWLIYEAGLRDGSMMQAGAASSFYGQVLNCRNPMQGWVKYEVLIRATNGSGDFFRIFENGRLVLNYTNRFDANPEPNRIFSFGGYARQYNQPGNFRYFTDCYLDRSLARIMLINSPTFDAFPTVRENQIPEEWSDTMIQFRCWQGAHQSLSGVSLYVVGANNTRVKIGTFL